jgi:hypothetical protein
VCTVWKIVPSRTTNIDLEIKLFPYMTEDRFAIFTHVSENLSASAFRKKTLINHEPVIFDNRDR